LLLLQLLHGDVKLECFKLVTALLSASDVTADVARTRLLEACHTHRNGWGSLLEKALTSATAIATSAAINGTADVAADVAAVSQVHCSYWYQCCTAAAIVHSAREL
jgi:putative effector of murein hydrolase